MKKKKPSLWVQELGINSDQLQMSIGSALAMNPNLQPCDACARLIKAANVLQDVDGAIENALVCLAFLGARAVHVRLVASQQYQPDGESDEQLRGVMGGLAAMFLVKGADLMAARNTTAVYTAVFYTRDPANEIGLYGYEFATPIDATMFEAHGELNGELHVLGNRMLIVLWRERSETTVECFQAISNVLENVP